MSGDISNNDTEIASYDVSEAKAEIASTETTSESTGDPVTVNVNFKLDNNPIISMGGVFSNAEKYLTFLPQSREQTAKRLKDVENKKIRGDKKKIAPWYEEVKIGNSMEFTHVYADTPSALQRKDADWGQSIEHNGETIKPFRPRAASMPTTASGDEAILLARAAGRLGTTISVPLVHTGIWVSVKAPTEDTLLQVEHAIERNKVSLGASTVGGVFSASSVFMLRPVINMVLDHIYESTFHSLDNTDLRNNVLITDVPFLIGATAAVIYPNGYNLSRPCVSDPAKCHHVDTGKVNLGRMLMFDRNKISTAQKNHLRDVNATHTVESLKKYQLDHIAPQHTAFDLNEDIKIHLSVPTIGDHIRFGVSWVESIVSMIDATFKREVDEDTRSSYIDRHGVTTRMRRYGPWVSKIVLNDTTVIDDRNAIESVLSEWSGDDELYKAFCKNVENFITGATIAAVGIPTHDCPLCKQSPNESITLTSLPGLIEVEPLETFFTLQFQTLSKMLS